MQVEIGGVCIRAPDVGYTYVHAHMVYMYPWEGGVCCIGSERGTSIPYPPVARNPDVRHLIPNKVQIDTKCTFRSKQLSRIATWTAPEIDIQS